MWKRGCHPRFTNAEALRLPARPPVPGVTGWTSAMAEAGLWHVAQLTSPWAESRVSKNRCRPNSHLASFKGLSSGQSKSGK